MQEQGDDGDISFDDDRDSEESNDSIQQQVDDDNFSHLCPCKIGCQLM